MDAVVRKLIVLWYTGDYESVMDTIWNNPSLTQDMLSEAPNELRKAAYVFSPSGSKLEYAGQPPLPIQIFNRMADRAIALEQRE